MLRQSEKCSRFASPVSLHTFFLHLNDIVCDFRIQRSSIAINSGGADKAKLECEIVPFADGPAHIG